MSGYAVSCALALVQSAREYALAREVSESCAAPMRVMVQHWIARLLELGASPGDVAQLLVLGSGELAGIEVPRAGVRT